MAMAGLADLLQSFPAGGHGAMFSPSLAFSNGTIALPVAIALQELHAAGLPVNFAADPSGCANQPALGEWVRILPEPCLRRQQSARRGGRPAGR
jgi:hypothetical protein